MNSLSILSAALGSYYRSRSTHRGGANRLLQRAHTRNRRLRHHPRAHCVLVARRARSRPLAPYLPAAFILPVEVLRRASGKFVAALETAFLACKIGFRGYCVPLAEPQTFPIVAEASVRSSMDRCAKRSLRSPHLAPLRTCQYRVAVQEPVDKWGKCWVTAPW